MNMKKSREEDLARRYCEYLGLQLHVTRRPNGKILAVEVHPTEPNAVASAEYLSFRSFFFGDDLMYGMCEKIPENFSGTDTAVWNEINDMIIPASTLDELEMQLSVRGF